MFSRNKKRREIERALGVLEDAGRLRRETRQARARPIRRGLDPGPRRSRVMRALQRRLSRADAEATRAGPEADAGVPDHTSDGGGSSWRPETSPLSHCSSNPRGRGEARSSALYWRAIVDPRDCIPQRL